MGDFQELLPIVKSEVFKRYETRLESKRARTLGIILCKDSQFVAPASLRYFVNPPLMSFPLNLNLGYEDYKKRSEEYFEFHLKKLETFLMKNSGRSLLKNKEKQVICTSRNTLKALLMTPYRLTEGWTIKAIKFGGIIYISKVKPMRSSKTPHETYHFKFQQYCFTDSPLKTPCTDEPIDENKQYSCIFETTLDQYDILYAAEIAGVESKYPIQNFKNAETLDKSRFVLTKLLHEKFSGNWKKHPKLLNWWIQCYLGRVDKVYVGFKSVGGYVHKPVECIQARDLPQYQKWKPEVCKRFLCEFLKKLENTMRNINSPYITYEIKYDAALKMGKYRVIENVKKEQFLSDQFIQYIQM